ncbi:hypothetical protein Pcinc_041240 [Petrolisthes cinctipes]|uniref:Uncharacterized protein n=1 Tax=Petrolisthes cinctipes TaxID=88211 RepID=A0AAE1BKI6_PETCI|nr:hypothetical protein Pcinc_041240 [Petrolisthes cinctipes]
MKLLNISMKRCEHDGCWWYSTSPTDPNVMHWYVHLITAVLGSRCHLHSSGTSSRSQHCKNLENGSTLGIEEIKKTAGYRTEELRRPNIEREEEEEEQLVQE